MLGVILLREETRCQETGSQDLGGDTSTGSAARAERRKSGSCCQRVGFFSSLHLQLAGSVSVWRMGVSQGQEALRTAAQIEGAADSVDLSDRDDEESGATEVCVCIVD